MYVLVQSVIITNTSIKEHPLTFGYEHVPVTPGLYSNNTNDITFTMVVDNFGIKYIIKKCSEDLINALQ